jgi:hypothetical protein
LRWCAAIVAVGFALRVLHVLWRYDVDWEPDGYLHVLFARSVFVDPPATFRFAIHVWAKPLYTFVVAVYDAVLPAALPRVPAVQVLNAGFWLVAMGFVVAMVRARSRNRATPVAVCAAGAFSYVFFRDSVTANTEPMSAAVTAVGLWLWHRGRQRSALFVFGLLALVRIDAVVLGAVFWATGIWFGELRSPARWVLGAILFAIPVMLWNVAGWVFTGSRLFVLTHGYSSVPGFFGFGRPMHFLTEFLAFEPLLFTFGCLGALLAVITRPADRLLVPIAIATGLHFVVLSAMWTFGIASAGLLRYFVFAYPGYLLLAARGFDWTFEGLQERVPSAVTGLLAAMIVLGPLQLHWLVRAPQWRHSLTTALVPSPFRSLPDLVRLDADTMLYTDRPEVTYYLGRTPASKRMATLDRVRDASTRGVFVFVQGWSEYYAQVEIEDFRGLEPVAEFDLPEQKRVFVFRR